MLLPDLVIPECPIKHHHSCFPLPLVFFSLWLFHFSSPLSPPQKQLSCCFIFLFHASFSRSASPSYTHSQGVFPLFPASCSQCWATLYHACTTALILNLECTEGLGEMECSPSLEALQWKGRELPQQRTDCQMRLPTRRGEKKGCL